MSFEFINRITVKKDGVYVSSRSSNDTSPYRSWKCEGLSKAYDSEGQKGLDREVIRMLYENAQLRGNHKSLERYRHVIGSDAAHAIYQEFIRKTDEQYEQMSEADRDSVWFKPTEKAKEYRAYAQEMREKMYFEIAELCEEYYKNTELKKY